MLEHDFLLLLDPKKIKIRLARKVKQRHFVYYNLVWIHQTLRVTPATEAGLMTSPMDIRDLVLLAT
jgi:hypothetical protein